MKKKKSPLLKITKETPEARKKRVSSGMKFRAAIFDNKKKRMKDKFSLDKINETDER